MAGHSTKPEHNWQPLAAPSALVASPTHPCFTMGAEQSAQAKALKDVAKLTSTKVPQWRETLDKFNDLVAQAYRADPTKLMLECKEKKVADVLVRLLREVLSAVAAPNVPPAKDVVAILAALRTVLTSKSIFKLVPRTDLEPVTQALSRFSQLPHTRRSADVEVLGLQVLRVAVERLFETDQPKYDKSEKTNKDHLVRIGLLDLLKQLYQLYTASATQHPAPLVELLSVFESFLTSHPHTTDFAVMQSLLEFLQESRDSLLELTRHPHPEVRPLACRLLQGAMLRMSVAEAVALQEHARKDGALLWQLALAVADADQQMRVARTFLAGTVPPPGEPGFAASGPALADVRIAMPGLSPASPATQSPHQRAPMVARQSSRHLLHLLCSRNEASMAVIKRVVPARLFVALNEPKRAEAAGAAPSSPFHPPAQDVVAANRDQRHRQSLTVQVCMRVHARARTVATISHARARIRLAALSNNGSRPPRRPAIAATGPPSSLCWTRTGSPRSCCGRRRRARSWWTRWCARRRSWTRCAEQPSSAWRGTGRALRWSTPATGGRCSSATTTCASSCPRWPSASCSSPSPTPPTCAAACTISVWWHARMRAAAPA